VLYFGSTNTFSSTTAAVGSGTGTYTSEHLTSGAWGEGGNKWATRYNAFFDANCPNAGRSFTLGAFTSTSVTEYVSGTNEFSLVSLAKESINSLYAEAVVSGGSGSPFPAGENIIVRLYSLECLENDSINSAGEGYMDGVTARWAADTEELGLMGEWVMNDTNNTFTIISSTEENTGWVDPDTITGGSEPIIANYPTNSYFGASGWSVDSIHVIFRPDVD